MSGDRILRQIKARLSLRPPQVDSLDAARNRSRAPRRGPERWSTIETSPYNSINEFWRGVAVSKIL